MHDTPLRITSLQNDQVKALVRLRQRRTRDERQVTIIEEPLVLARALAEKYPLDTLYCCPEILRDEHRDLLAELGRAAAAVVELSPPVMAKVSYREQSAGLLAVAPQRRHELAVLLKKPATPPLLVVLESVEKPGNLGAVLRVADGAGADGVIVCGQGTDLFNPNVLRASRGACFAIPTVAAGGNAVRSWLDARGVRTLATSPMATATWDMADFTGPVAIVLGTEHQGLTQDWLDTTDENIAIPMAGIGDSLNVAATAAVLLFEAVRQRRAPQEAE